MAFKFKNACRFGDNPSDLVMRDNLTGAGLDSAAIVNIVEAGISWTQLLRWLFTYGSMFVNVANQVIVALRDGTLSLEQINALITQYGPQFLQAIKELLEALGISWPAT